MGLGALVCSYQSGSTTRLYDQGHAGEKMQKDAKTQVIDSVAKKSSSKDVMKARYSTLQKDRYKCLKSMPKYG